MIDQKKILIVLLSVLLIFGVAYATVWPSEQQPLNTGVTDTFVAPESDYFNETILEPNDGSLKLVKAGGVTFIKLITTAQQYADAKKYGVYLISATKKTSKSSWTCWPLRAPCKYYVCDEKYHGLSAIRYKPYASNECGNGYCCAYIKYPWSYI